MKKLLWVLLLFTADVANAEDVNKIIDNLLAKYRSVQSYEASAVIKPDISFLRILPQNAKVYFRQPDQFRIKTPGISILPKQQFDNIFTILSRREAYMPVFTGREKNGKSDLAVINVIPLGDTSELILAKLWVDDVRNLVMRAQLTTRTNGTIDVSYVHGKYAQYGLPDQIIFTVDVKKFKVPKAVAADINTTSKSDAENEKLPKKGTITISLSEYILNAKIPDKIFREK